MKVSIVMPVYNTRRSLLERMLDSILAQTEQSFELIIIDDGSNAETAEALDAIAQRDSRISVYHQQNQGGGGFPARYDGIAKAKGDYIYVPDSDDILHPRLLEYCLWAAESKGIEFLAFRFAKMQGGATPEVMDLPDFDKSPLFAVDGTSDVEAFKKALSLVHVDNWAQFATRELMQSLPPRRVSDLTRTFRLIKGAKRWAATPLQLYFYDTGVSDSVTHKKYPLEQITYLHKDLLELCDLYEDERKRKDPVWESICRNSILSSVKIAYNAMRRRKLVAQKCEYRRAFAAMLHDLFIVRNIPTSWVKFKHRVAYAILMFLWRGSGCKSKTEDCQ